ncbi:MAG: nicotinamide riboside transporter PnuC [Candidatus Paceibacterota bacterium]
MVKLGLLLVIQFWAWQHWVSGGANRTELPVTMLKTSGRLLALMAIVAGSVVVYTLIDLLVPGSQNPIIDAIVVSSSVVAQYLLGRKNVESWILWLGPVNLLSIILFYSAGAFTVMALYMAFLIHALFAIRSWYRSVQVTS